MHRAAITALPLLLALTVQIDGGALAFTVDRTPPSAARSRSAFGVRTAGCAQQRRRPSLSTRSVAKEVVLRSCTGQEHDGEAETGGNADNGVVVGRRSLFNRGAAAVMAASGLSSSTSSSSAASAASPIENPVCVIGCNGRTGTEVVSYLLSKSVAVRATSRGGSYDAKDSISGDNVSLLAEATCDVTNPSTVQSAVSNARAVIFAASASKQGGPPAAVDNAGLVSVAKACIEARVPHLVVVSSGAVTKPSSPVYLFLNLFGNIMEEKIRGEDAVRNLYAEHNRGSDTKLTYTIIRPGGLTLDPPRSVQAVELNQGDTKSGRIARADVAALCAEAIKYPSLTGGTTFECYDADTGAALATVGLSNIAKAKTDSAAFISGKERRGDTYQELFRGLELDKGYAK